MLMFIARVCLEFSLIHVIIVRGEIWEQWNKADTRKFGMETVTKMHHDAISFCQSLNFHNLITLWSSDEEAELDQFIQDYETATLGAPEFFDKVANYWLGTVRKITASKDTFTWVHYANTVANYTNWQLGFPIAGTNQTCAYVHRRCVEGCSIKWMNRACDNTKGIDAIICESREKRPELDRIKEQIKSKTVANSYMTEQWIEAVYNSSLKKDLSVTDTADGIRVLLAIANRDENVEVSETAVHNVFLVLETYREIILENSHNFTTQREDVVLTIEMFLNRLKISDGQSSVKFSSSFFTAQVQYASSLPIEDITFSTIGEQAVSITLPKNAFIGLNEKVGAGNQSRVSFIHYLDDTFFPSRYNVSQVVAAQINLQPIKGLIVPVTYTISLSPKSNPNDILLGKCATWNFSTSSWSDQGCNLLAKTDPPLCGCNHLTNFALLVEIIKRPSYTTFDYVNRVIGGISCLGFFLTAIIYICYKDLRTSNPGPVHINLCICYGLGYLVFLAGSDKVESYIPCVVVTVLTHYFFLAGWIWTFIEAFTMHQLLVKKSTSLGERYHIYTTRFSYLLPLIVVGLNVALTIGYYDLQPSQSDFVRLSDNLTLYNSAYVSNYACWLSGYSLYFGFLVEGAIIFLMNVFFYVMVLRSITWKRKMIRSTRNESSPRETFCRAVTIGSLLGLVWLLAIPLELLASRPSLVEPVTYLFSLLIATQGIVIFYLFCLRHTRTRRLWWNPVWSSIRRRIFCCVFDNSFVKIRYDMKKMRSTQITRASLTHIKIFQLFNKESDSSSNALAI